MPDTYLQILHRYWGYDDFRGIQREIIESIGSGHDTLGLMPTGGGKSVTFQVPALAQEGVCIVVTPLIALMKDQVQNLRRKGIRAAAVHSGLEHHDIIQTLENAIFGGVKLLYVSPERLSSPIFIQKVRHMRVSFICVDEAHCISQWGYDFRPSYLAIASIRKEVPDAPVLALTATATPLVVDDIQTQLNFREKRVFRAERDAQEREAKQAIGRDFTERELKLRDMPQELWVEAYEAMGRDQTLRKADPKRAMAYMDAAGECARPRQRPRRRRLPMRSRGTRRTLRARLPRSIS